MSKILPLDDLRTKSIYIYVITGVIFGLLFFFFRPPLFSGSKNAPLITQLLISFFYGLFSWLLFIFLGILLFLLIAFSYFHILSLGVPTSEGLIKITAPLFPVFVEGAISLVIALVLFPFLPPPPRKFRVNLDEPKSHLRKTQREE